jgi:hypothetical protein
MGKYPREWLDQVEALVFASLVRGEIRLILHPGGSGALRDVPIETVPPELRMPNTKVWVRLDDSMNVVRVWRRES